jgi:Secretion system C-terminal sorting domain
MNKLLLTCEVLCFNVLIGRAQLLPNGDMETWVDGQPEGWISNVIFQANYADVEDFSEISGNPGSAMHVWNALGTRNTISFDTDGYLPFTTDATQLSFDYRLNLTTGESVFAAVSLYNSSYQLIGIANAYLLAADNSSAWQTKTVNFDPFSNPGPVTMVSVNVSMGSANILQSASYFDFDNIRASGEATGIINNSNDVDLLVYPIPASDRIYVEMSEEKVDSFEIYDLSGRMCLNQNNVITGRSEIDLKSLESGIYMLNVKTNSGVHTKRIQIQK